MNRVFLSHSSKQKELVRKVASNLGKAQCVFDGYEFESGMSLLDDIIRGIRNTEIFVLFISDDALNSDWVKKEITLAKLDHDSNKKKKIFPILIDKSISISGDSRIPEWFKEYLLKPITDPFIIYTP